jgi:hypothetical protein
MNRRIHMCDNVLHLLSFVCSVLHQQRLCSVLLFSLVVNLYMRKWFNFANFLDNVFSLEALAFFFALEDSFKNLRAQFFNFAEVMR